MSDRTVRIILAADVGPYKSAMRRASAAADNAAQKGAASWKRLRTSILENEQAASRVTGVLTGIGAAATAAGVAAVKVFADFDQAMSSVQAATGETGAAFDGLRNLAMELGSSTAFSATEAAQGIDNLARAGVTTADIMGGALAGSLDLAASGQMAVGDAAELASTAMTQFNLAGRDVGHVADLLAAGAGKAMGEVEDIGAALRQSGLVASQFGLTIEETVGGLSAFASAGLLGSDAGTSFKSMLLALANPSQQTQQTMEKLGISAYDASGQFIGLAALAGELQDKMGGLDDATRQQAMAQIFGTDAMRAAAVLYEEGADGIQQWTDAVNDAGYASEQAAKLQDNLKGDLEQLGGAAETFAIKMGSAADGPIRFLVQQLTEFISVLAETPGAAQALMVAAGGIGGLTLAAAGLVKSVRFVHEFRDALKSLGASDQQLNKARASVVRLGEGVLAAGVAFGALRAAQEVFMDVSMSADELATKMELVAKGGANLSEAFAGAGAALLVNRDGVESLDEAFATLAKKPDEASQSVNRFIASLTGVETPYIQLENRLEQVGQQLANMPIADAQVQFAELRQAAEDNGYSLDDLMAKTSAYGDHVRSLAAEAGVLELSQEELASLMGGDMVQGLRLSADGTELLSGAQAEAAEAAQQHAEAQETAAQAAEEQAQAAADAAQALLDYYSAVIGAENSQIALESAIDDATEAARENGQTLDINTEAGRANKTALLGVAEAALRVANDMAEAGASTADIEARTQSARAQFIAAAQAMGMGADEANAYADELGLIPSQVSTLVTTPGVNDSKRNVQGLVDVIGRVPASTTASVRVNVDPGGIYALNNTLNRINGRTYTAAAAVKVFGQGAVATGGYGGDVAAAVGLAGGGMPPNTRRVAGLLEGPGTPTSDSIPAWLSRKEFVTQASAVAYYGTDLMYAMNRRAIPKEAFAPYGFAGGGSPSVVSRDSFAPSPAPAMRTTAVVDSSAITSAVRAGLANAVFVMDGQVIDVRLDARDAHTARRVRRGA